MRYDERTRHSFGGIAAKRDEGTASANCDQKGGEKRTLEPACGRDNKEDEKDEARANADRGHDVVPVALDGARPARRRAQPLRGSGDAACGRHVCKGSELRDVEEMETEGDVLSRVVMEGTLQVATVKRSTPTRGPCQATSREAPNCTVYEPFRTKYLGHMRPRLLKVANS